MTPPGYRIRPARRSDLAALPAIEREAARLFETQPVALLPGVLADVTSMEAFEAALRGGWLLVAEGPGAAPVGFALMDPMPGAIHLDELDVHPDHARRGLGAALVRSVCEAARQRGYRAVTLTTFREVPWNAPFYERLGFRALAPAELTPELRALTREEEAAGLRAEERVVMRCDVPS